MSNSRLIHKRTEGIHGIDREQLWLAFVRAVSKSTDSWFVWKNIDSAFYRAGDVDALSVPEEFGIVERTFAAWAEAEKLGPGVRCDHIPGGMNLVAMSRDRTSLLEVGNKVFKTFRGAVLVTRENLSDATIWDERGFRTISPGPEAVLKLVLNGIQPWGRVDPGALRAKRVLEGLRMDPVGARSFARNLRSVPTSATISLIDAVLDENWSRSSAIAIEIHSLIGAALTPAIAFRRAVFQTVPRRCAVVASLSNPNRTLPDPDEWLERAQLDHRIIA